MATKKTTEKKTAEKKKSVGGKSVAKKTTNTRTAKKAHRTSFATHDGHALTANEAKFIDEYIQTGNGRQSYINAYPKASITSAAQLAQRLLNKDYITGEINWRLQQAKNESIASAEEIMNYLSSVMRGEVKDAFGLDAPLSERTRAAVELAKRQIDIPNKVANAETPELKITLDFGRNDTTKTVAEVLGVNTKVNTEIEGGDTGE